LLKDGEENDDEDVTSTFLTQTNNSTNINSVRTKAVSNSLFGAVMRQNSHWSASLFPSPTNTTSLNPQYRPTTTAYRCLLNGRLGKILMTFTILQQQLIMMSHLLQQPITITFTIITIIQHIASIDDWY